MKILASFFCKSGVITAFLTGFYILAGVFTMQAQTQTETFATGSYIVNMGVTPQTVGNGLKPYGLIYDLLKNNKVPNDWVIKTGKSQDGVGFTYNGVDYKGGPFIIRAEYRTNAVNTAISSWQSLGVVGITTTTPVTVPVYLTFLNTPKWTMDLQNGKIAVSFFSYAGIPASAYGEASTFWKTPAQLDCCDDIFVMPPTYSVCATHGHLLERNSYQNNGGAILGVPSKGCSEFTTYDNLKIFI